MEAAIRETLEETGIIVVKCKPLFVFSSGKREIHTFIATKVKGKASKTSTEGKPIWIKLIRLLRGKNQKYFTQLIGHLLVAGTRLTNV